jgi:hypothetical protein
MGFKGLLPEEKQDDFQTIHWICHIQMSSNEYSRPICSLEYHFSAVTLPYERNKGSYQNTLLIKCEPADGF